ncbi:MULTISPECIES: TetR/AcrR family transcriptional regulator [unclassified Ochrobactrum]|uniref:TetR/AcrR family transcriptional regulator n=1 Tax=unclassified Ochrobactrum TaxID=239106 RepID=UPI0015FCC92B|nr:TetR/AcrR family transcriptional repressor of nem operon [Ochrobactrum sp. RH2CCR150]MDH7787459.1 TetR/AcrR family transcriptional repressor of nem operon [Ochrobactrum sp. 19YEA23]
MSNLTTTSEDILNCARSLVIAGGYNGFSYADIATVVGIRKASIHHHFPSKVDLVKALIARHHEDTEAGFANLERSISDRLEQLRAYTHYWAACIKDASASFCVCALLASELPVLPAEIVPEVRAYFKMLSSWLTSVLERGALEGRVRLNEAPHIEAEAFMATVHGAMLSARAYGDPDMFPLVTEPLLRRLSAE